GDWSSDVCSSDLAAAEGCPGCETKGRGQLHARRGGIDVAAWIGHLEGALLLIQLALESRELLDLRGIQRRGQHDSDGDHSFLLGALSRRRLTSSHWMFWKASTCTTRAGWPHFGVAVRSSNWMIESAFVHTPNFPASLNDPSCASMTFLPLKKTWTWSPTISIASSCQTPDATLPSQPSKRTRRPLMTWYRCTLSSRAFARVM